MRQKYLTAFLCLMHLGADAQIIQDTSGCNLNEFIFSGNKFPEHKKNIAQQIQVINKDETEQAMSQNTGLLLEQTGNVFVQKSQMGGGSPVLRGFEANRVLMIIDGVRMNNALYRGGHLQNVITVDNNLLERTEILFGPASTIYGSDALGGVIIFTTRRPELSLTGKTNACGNVMYRYSSAYDEQTGHFDFNIGGKKLASLTSVTYSKFGDLRQGAYRNPFYGDFGLCNEYADRLNGVDTILNNSDPHIQKKSGYNQTDVLEKILFRPHDHVAHTLNLQYSTSSNIPRYDRLTDKKNGMLRWAEWYYGPQERMMAAYQLDAKLNGAFDELKIGLNYQAIEESRHQRECGKNNLQSRIENVSVAGYNIDLRNVFRNQELIIGTDGQYNAVSSEAYQKDIINGMETPIDTRYPDGGSSMLYASVYAQYLYKIIPDKLVLNAGVRLNFVSLRSKFDDTTFFPFPFDEAEQNSIAWSGHIGLVLMADTHWRIALNGATGFRAPNVDDMSKVFESAGGASLVVPNSGLKPEYSYNADLGLAYTYEGLKIEATGFYTLLQDAIIRDVFTLDGADSLMYNGSLTAVVANQNKARAFIYGFNAGLSANLIRGVSIYSHVNFTYGRYFDVADNEAPMDHIPPVFGKAGIRWKAKKFQTDAFALYNGWKYLKDYNPYGEDNQQYATAMGMPEWFTLNLRAGYKLNKHFSFELAVENILDYNYRVFASGIQSAGRNFVVSLRGSL